MSNTIGIRIALLRVALFALAASSATGAFAGYELYKQDETKLDLNLMVIGAQFGQNQPWFGEQRALLGVSASHWTEFGTEFGLSGEMALGGGTLFSEVSGVYTRSSGDDASGITAGLDDMSATTLEQANLGWKKSDVFAGLEEDSVTVQIGRFDYSIGTGLLVNDGGSDGGERGGWYIGLRKAFQNGAIVKLDSSTLKTQVFHLKNNPRSGGNQGTGDGANIDYTFGESGVTLGTTYIYVDRDLPGVGEIDVYNARAEWKGAFLLGLSFSGEFVHQDSNELDDDGYYAQALYEFADVAWTPALTYRYAEFDKNFNPLAYGYTDYGYWFQGEIAGNYPLYNNNLKSNMVRVNVKPREDVTVNLFYYNFKSADAAARGVASDDLGDEVNLIVDWQATERIFVSAVLAQLNPGDGAEQATGGDKDWQYAMLSVSFTL